MRKLNLLLFVFLVCYSCYSQDSILYKRYVANTIVSREHGPETKKTMGSKKVKVPSDNTEVTYYFNKHTKELWGIGWTSLDDNLIEWAYNYSFIDGQFVRLTKINRHVWAKEIPQAIYYFDKGVVVSKTEIKATVEDLEGQSKRAEELRAMASQIIK
jgi:hypothetical protein